MNVYIYDTSTQTYINVADYLHSIVNPDGDIYRLLMLFNLQSLFEDVKKRTAWRARFAKNAEGQSLIDNLVITDDDRDMFDDLMKTGCNEVYRPMSAWGKDIEGAIRFNVKFGDPVHGGTVLSGGSTTQLTVPLPPLTDFSGYKIVITSAGVSINQERVIVSNTMDTITLDSAFDMDVTGLEYAIFTQTDDFIIYYLNMSKEWDLNALRDAYHEAREALISYSVKEWYVVNRYMDDAQIEQGRYGSHLTGLRSALMRRKKPLRRGGEIFS